MRRKRSKNYGETISYEGQTIRTLVSGRKRYMADFCALGHRERKYFATLPEAKTFIDQKKIETKNKGRAAFDIDDRDRLDLSAAREKIGDTSLASIVEFWLAHHPIGETKTVQAVVEEFLLAPGRRGTKIVERRAATTEGHRKRLISFCEAFGARPLHEIGQPDIEAWLDVNGWTGLNRRHYLATVRALLNHAVRKKYVVANVGMGIELPDAGTAEPVIMTVADVDTYLHSIEATCSELLPREAIAFFCGLRPEELSRLDWKNISVENKLITVSGDVAKVQGHRRNVEIPDNLMQWLAPYVRDTGPVWPFASATTLHRKRTEAREKAGVEVPDNAGRHAFASYHLAAHESAPKTAHAMGHADTDLLMQTYRNITASDGRPITKKNGEAYFNIMPKRERNVIRLSMAG